MDTSLLTKYLFADANGFVSVYQPANGKFGILLEEDASL